MNYIMSPPTVGMILKLFSAFSFLFPCEDKVDPSRLSNIVGTKIRGAATAIELG